MGRTTPTLFSTNRRTKKWLSIIDHLIAVKNQEDQEKKDKELKEQEQKREALSEKKRRRKKMKPCRYCRRKFLPDGRQKITCGRTACQTRHKRQYYKKTYILKGKPTKKSKLKAAQRKYYNKHRLKILARQRKRYTNPEVKTTQLKSVKANAQREDAREKKKKRNKKYWKKYARRASVKNRRALVHKAYLGREDVKERKQAYIRDYMRQYRHKIINQNDMPNTPPRV